MPSDPTLYLYTSLTAGSSHIITATSRIETILKANKVPFKAVDCATDEKARMIWQRRSKGKKLPGLVKFNDVIADFEQIEEWNEHGELEDEIEAVIDIFGDVPVSGTVADAQAAAAARASAQQGQAGSSAQARTASETRHISISDPKDARKKSEPSAGLPQMSAAMRQAGAEAAAKAGQKKAPSDPSTGPSAVTDTAVTGSAPSATDSTAPATLPESQEPSTVTDAKTPDVLASEGASKTSIDKIQTSATTDEEPSSMSTLEQTLDQKRKHSVPGTRSSLAQTTSIDDSHTVTSSDDVKAAEASSRFEKPRTQHRGSDLDIASVETIREIEKRNSIAEVDEEEDSSEEEEESDNEEEDGKGADSGIAKKVGATSKQEGKVTGAQKTQDQDAKDGDKAGVSVGD